MKSARPWLIALLVMGTFLSSALAGSPDDIRFESLGEDQGMRWGAVPCMLQDRLGYLWFGTSSGLVRYDGYEFRTYRSIPGDPTTLQSDWIGALLEDRRGDLWVGVFGGTGSQGGLSRYDRVHDRFMRVDTELFKASPGVVLYVNALAEDARGILWIGTMRGLIPYDPVTGKAGLPGFHPPPEMVQLMAAPFDESKRVWGIMVLDGDAKGRLWIGHRYGLTVLDPTRSECRDVTIRDVHSGARALLTPSSIHRGRNGELWVGTWGGLVRVDPETLAATLFTRRPTDARGLPSNIIQSVLGDSTGRLWVGTQEGLCDFDPESGLCRTVYRPVEGKPGTLNSASISFLYEDRSETLWVGQDMGLSKADRLRERFEHLRHEDGDAHSLCSDNVFSALEDSKGRLWVGTDKGLTRIELAQGRYAQFKHDSGDRSTLSDDWVTSLLEARDGTVWAGTGKGLDCFDEVAGSFRRVKDIPSLAEVKPERVHIRYLAEDGEGKLWMEVHSNYEGALVRVNPATGTVKRFESDPGDRASINWYHSIGNIFVDGRGAVWIGTGGGGLARFVLETGAFVRYEPVYDVEGVPQTDHLINGIVQALAEDRLGNLWVGGPSGLDKLSIRTGKIDMGAGRNILARGLLPDPHVTSAARDGRGFIWLTHEHGVSCLNPWQRTFVHYSPLDGLRSWQYRSVVSGPSGRIYLLGENGVEWLHPDGLKINRVRPQVQITDFKIFNKSVVPGAVESPLSKPIWETKAITLTHNQNVFSFDFIALHFTNPTQNRYSYRLMKGDLVQERYPFQFDGRSQQAVYSNLPAGRYAFEVSATNSDGILSKDWVSVDITILPPPWKTWWAYFLYGLMIVGAALAYNGYRNRRQEEAVERERMQRELDLARSIQKTFLPASLPEIPGLALAARTQMSMEVGGDLYGAFPIPGGVRVVVGDVSGKGVGGALYMAVAVSLLDDLTKAELGPGATLAKLDGQLKERLGGKRFVTCVVADINPAGGRIRIANAGHLPPLVVKGGAVRELAIVEPGPPLGTPLEAEYEEGEVALEWGSGLVFYTDGFPEAQAPGTSTLLGFDGFEAWLREIAASPEAMAEGLMKRLAAYSGDSLVDDATLVVVEMR